MHPILPIYTVMPLLLEAVQNHAITLLIAEPGAGKSTVVPLEIWKLKCWENKKIILLEPRRLAAKTVATRLAASIGEELGRTVGYRTRLESMVSPHTQIEVITEGILSRMILNDSTLSEVGVLIFDEFHERSLPADTGLALCNEIQQVLRDDLKIVVMSATISETILEPLQTDVKLIKCKGRTFPVSIFYNQYSSNEPIYQQVANKVHEILHQTKGDILVFLPGKFEIQKAAELLHSLDLIICPLYGDLDWKEQQLAILPASKRKIILSTSIAETSLTIEGVETVIDSGLARIAWFDVKTGLSKLTTVAVSIDAADQRAGRAGRLSEGACYRLWTRGRHEQLELHRKPEILESDLSSLVLELYAQGIMDCNELKWISPPPKQAWQNATALLELVGIIENKKITTHGKLTLAIPTHPRISSLFVHAQQLKLLPLACDIAAILEEKDPLLKHDSIDWYLRIKVLREFRSGERINADRNILARIDKAALYWLRYFKISADNSLPNEFEIGLLLSFAYPDRIAKKNEHNAFYRLMNGKQVQLSKIDPLEQFDWLVISQLDAQDQLAKAYAASAFNPYDLKELFTKQVISDWDYNKGVLTAREETCLYSIAVEKKNIALPALENRKQILEKVIQKQGLSLFNWTETLQSWKIRLEIAKNTRPEMEIPVWDEDYIINWILTEMESEWITCVNKNDFNKLDLESFLLASLDWDLKQKINKYLPTHIVVPTGSAIAIDYEQSPPVMAVRLQEVFGMTETPIINDGLSKIMMHLLSPGFKPVQVTQDLNSFWNTTYFEVKKELKNRYKKHSWPDNPLEADPISGAKRRVK